MALFTFREETAWQQTQDITMATAEGNTVPASKPWVQSVASAKVGSVRYITMNHQTHVILYHLLLTKSDQFRDTKNMVMHHEKLHVTISIIFKQLIIVATPPRVTGRRTWSLKRLLKGLFVTAIGDGGQTPPHDPKATPHRRAPIYTRGLYDQ